MRLLDRYLIRELLIPLAFCLGGFLIFWISADAFNNLAEFQEARLRPMDILEYYLVMTPEFVVAILPIVLLLALLYTLTHHSRHNEITAMRAAGVSLWRICVPYLAVGLLASVVLFGLNEGCVPRGAEWADRIKTRYVQRPGDAGKQAQFHNFGFTNMRDHRIWFFTEYHVQTSEMLTPKVRWTLPDGWSRLLVADRAIRTNGVWTFFNATEYTRENTNADLVPLLQSNVLAMPEFKETPMEIQSEVEISRYLNLGGTKKANIPLVDIWNYLRSYPDLPHDDSCRLLTKLHDRLASPWTCMVVVLIAIPFGAASGRRNVFFGVAGSIFVCFAYFVIQQVSLALGTSGHLPPWLAAWLPNLIFGATGVVLTTRMR